MIGLKVKYHDCLKRELQEAVILDKILIGAEYSMQYKESQAYSKTVYLAKITSNEIIGQTLDEEQNIINKYGNVIKVIKIHPEDIKEILPAERECLDTKVPTGYKDRDGENLFYGDIVDVSKFNGIYDFEGKCKIEMKPILTSLKNKDDSPSTLCRYFDELPTYYYCCNLCNEKFREFDKEKKACPSCKAINITLLRTAWSDLLKKVESPDLEEDKI